jgi:hypothetical protein
MAPRLVALVFKYLPYGVISIINAWYWASFLSFDGPELGVEALAGTHPFGQSLIYSIVHYVNATCCVDFRDSKLDLFDMESCTGTRRQDHVQCDLYIESISALSKSLPSPATQECEVWIHQRLTLMTMAKAVATTSALGDVWFIRAVQ